MSEKRRVFRSAEEWRELFARQAASGISVGAFCRQEGITVGVYRRWDRKLRGDEAVRPPRQSTKSAVTAPFIDLGALGSSAARCEMRLDLGGGVMLHLVRS